MKKFRGNNKYISKLKNANLSAGHESCTYFLVRKIIEGGV